MAEIQWGTAPEWLGGVGTVLAFAATLYLISRERRDRLAVDERRALTEARQMRGAIIEGPDPMTWVLEITNRSPLLPFYNAYVQVRATNAGQVGQFSTWVIQAGEELTHSFRTDAGAEAPFMFDLFFDDSEGRRWVTDQEARVRRYRSQWVQDQLDDARGRTRLRRLIAFFTLRARRGRP